MIDSFAHKQIRCKHCEFGFSFTEFGSVARIVCPACGEETLSSSSAPSSVPPGAAKARTAKTLSEFSEATAQPLQEQLPQEPLPHEKPVFCSVEHCPLLTGEESGNPAAKQIKQQFRKKRMQRRTILAWTVALQVCVLFGATLFITNTLISPKDNPALQQSAMVRIDEKSIQEEPTETSIVYALPPVGAPMELQAKPSPVEMTDTTAGKMGGNMMTEDLAAGNIMPDAETVPSIASPSITSAPIPSAPIEMDYLVSPYETVQDIFPPLLLEPFIVAVPDTYVPATIPSPRQPAVPKTLEEADQLLESAKTTLATDPRQSVENAIRAAKLYEQLGETSPESMYWVLGNAFASLSWGEPLLDHSPAVEVMTLSPDGRYLLAHLRDKTVWLWDLQNPEDDWSGYPLDPGTSEYIKFVFTPDLRWIIGGQKNGTIRIWDMSLENPADVVLTFTERIPDLQDLQLSPNGQWLAAFGRSPREVALSENPFANQTIQLVHFHRGHLRDTSSYSVLLWNLRQMEGGVVPVAAAISSMPQPVQLIRFSPNSDRLAISRRDATVRVYDLLARSGSSEPFILRGHQLAVTHIAFAPSGQWVATGSQDNTIRLWNLTNSRLAPESATLHGHLGWISALAIDSSGKQIYSGSYDRTIRIWNLTHNRISTALHGEPIILEANLGVPTSLLVTQDGDKMVALSKDGSLGIYHLPSLSNNKSTDFFRAVTFRNSKLSISECLLTLDDQLLIFCYENLLNSTNSGIRLWSLQSQSFIW
jgi:WD40 repeat protein